MFPSKKRLSAAIAVIATAYASLAAAQQPAADAPPRLEKLEEGDAPAVTIRGSTPEQQITQTREQGRVTSVRVKTGNSTYYLKPNAPAGSALPGDVQSDATRPAQWQVLEFDLNRKPDQKQVEEQAANVPAPPPPPAGKPDNSSNSLGTTSPAAPAKK